MRVTLERTKTHLSSGSAVRFDLLVLSHEQRTLMRPKVWCCAGISASLRDHLRRTRPGVVVFVCLCMCAIWFTNCELLVYKHSAQNVWFPASSQSIGLLFQQRSPFKKLLQKSLNRGRFLRPRFHTNFGLWY